MRHYLMGRYGAKARWAMAIAALILVPVYFLPVLPVWSIHLRAPQYSEGLVVRIFAHTVGGDLRNVNLLNHYVGMKAISASDFREFAFMPGLLSLFGVWAAIAALWGRRWFAILGWALFSVAASVLLVDFAIWLYRYGHDLDPRAPLKLGAFTPPLIGQKRMGNFEVGSWPDIGGVLLLIAAGIGPVLAAIEWRHARRAIAPEKSIVPKANAIVAVVAAVAIGAIALVAPVAVPGSASAREIVVPAEGAGSAGARLAEALGTASAGDTLRLGAGVFHGNFASDVPLAILGRPGTILDGEGRGTVLRLSGGACRVEDLTIRRSGRSLLEDDAALRLVRAPASTVERVRIEGALHGIYLERAAGTRVAHVVYRGLRGALSENSNGNGVHLWYSPDVRIERNDVGGHRDGVYISFCRNVRITDSRFHDSDRYGLHYMYSDSNVITGCAFERNVAGAAIMFSNALVVTGNAFRDNSDPRAYGLLLRDCSGGVFERNRFEGNTIGVFLDNARRNRLADNTFAGNGWGLYLFASSTDNEFVRNDMIANLFPLALDTRRSRNRFHENFWGDRAGYDLDGDLRSDVPIRPVELFAFLSKRYPDLSLFADSPAIVALSAAERTLPSLAPSEVTDSLPAMRPWHEDGGGRRARGGSWPLAVGSGLVTLSGGIALWRSRRS